MSPRLAQIDYSPPLVDLYYVVRKYEDSSWDGKNSVTAEGSPEPTFLPFVRQRGNY